MCNACGFRCCGSDEFSGCGCDHCEEPECWSADWYIDDDEDDYGDEYDLCACRKPSSFICVDTSNVHTGMPSNVP